MRNVLRQVRRGFTLVELMLVLLIISVLLGLVTGAVMSSIRQARTHKGDACLRIIETGINSYHAQKNEWPGILQTYYENGLSNGRHTYTLSDSEYDEVVTEVVKESLTSSGTPLMDVNGLIVSPKGGNGSWSTEFREAVKQQHRHGGTIKLANMAFGYQTSAGKFGRFKLTYNADTDGISMSK